MTLINLIFLGLSLNFIIYSIFPIRASNSMYALIFLIFFCINATNLKLIFICNYDILKYFMINFVVNFKLINIY